MQIPGRRKRQHDCYTNTTTPSPRGERAQARRLTARLVAALESLVALGRAALGTLGLAHLRRAHLADGRADRARVVAAVLAVAAGHGAALLPAGDGHALGLPVDDLARGPALARDGGARVGALRDGVRKGDGGEERHGETVVQHCFRLGGGRMLDSQKPGLRREVPFGRGALVESLAGRRNKRQDEKGRRSG